jgi:hypothetical protein
MNLLVAWHFRILNLSDSVKMLNVPCKLEEETFLDTAIFNLSSVGNAEIFVYNHSNLTFWRKVLTIIVLLFKKS